MEKRIKENIDRIRARIVEAASRSGRDPGDVRILAAVKNRSVGEVSAAVGAGVRLLGENRVQEFLEKKERIGGSVEWHFIGHLQRNKVRFVVGSVELIHSLESERLAREIDKRAQGAGLVQPVLLQVNVAGEDSKFGIALEEAGEFLDSIVGLTGISVRGLSTIAPLVDDPEEVRWVFRELRGLGESLSERMGAGPREFSMGMTNDFEVAVEEGSTIVRIGTAIFDGV